MENKNRKTGGVSTSRKEPTHNKGEDDEFQDNLEIQEEEALAPPHAEETQTPPSPPLRNIQSTLDHLTTSVDHMVLGMEEMHWDQEEMKMDQNVLIRNHEVLI